MKKRKRPQEGREESMEITKRGGDPKTWGETKEKLAKERRAFPSPNRKKRVASQELNDI